MNELIRYILFVMKQFCVQKFFATDLRSLKFNDLYLRSKVDDAYCEINLIYLNV